MDSKPFDCDHFQSVLEGICLRCNKNVYEDRLATIEEMDAAVSLLDQASFEGPSDERPILRNEQEAKV